MPRHYQPPIEADGRLISFHPDRLPTHRRCARCAEVFPLDKLHFYERSERYPWNLTRFGSHCKPCASRVTTEHRAGKREQRNARDRQRYAERNGAERLMSAARLQRDAERESMRRIAEMERKTMFAKARRNFRVMARRSGPYVDPVKKMIRERQEEYARRPRESAEARERARALNDALRPGEKGRGGMVALEAIRAMHRRQTAQHATLIESPEKP